MSDTWALLKRLCRIGTVPDRSGRPSRAKYPKAPSTRSHGSFFSQIGISRLCFSQCPQGHKVQALDVSTLPNTHGSICCLHHLTTAKFPPSHFPVSESETLLQLGDCLLPDFISSTSNIVDGHTNDAMVFLLCVPQDQKHTVPRRMSRTPDLWLQQRSSSSTLLCHRPVH